jgi:hypothetical protein
MSMVPVQRGPLERGERPTYADGSKVPEWLAREAYGEYARNGHGDQSFEELHSRGGFGPLELMDLLAGGSGDGDRTLKLRATRELRPQAARHRALDIAHGYVREITDDQEWRERLVVTILRAANAINEAGVRPKDLASAMRALERGGP